MEKRNQEVFVGLLLVTLCLRRCSPPVSENSLTSSSSWLKRQLSFCLKIVVENCFEILFDFSFLVVLFMFILLFFLRAIVWGGMSTGVRMVVL